VEFSLQIFLLDLGGICKSCSSSHAHPMAFPILLFHT
jgi:Fe-S cluster biogenesis protein NfuA